MDFNLERKRHDDRTRKKNCHYKSDKDKLSTGAGKGIGCTV